MSSHHIVREKQEPALYIHQIGDFSEEYLGQLLEWSPTLIVNAAVYEKIVSLGLKVDVVLNAPDGRIVQENTKSIMGAGDEFDTVLNYLTAEKYPAVNIIDVNKKLIDFSYYLSAINIVLFSAIEKSYAVQNGFRVWKPAGSIFKIERASYFETSNLARNHDGDFVAIKDGFIELTFNAPYLLISEPL